MGPGGPLVRFDQSISPSSSSARTAAKQQQSTPANGGSPRTPEGRDGSARPGRSSRWSLGRRGQSELPAASFAAEEAFGSIVVLGLWWFPIEIEQGEGFRGGRESFWWREWRGGGSGGAGVVKTTAAAVFAGEEEDDPSGLSTTTGGSVRA